MHQEAREVRGAKKCRAVPLRREVLRAAGVPNGAAWSEALRRGSNGDAEARAKHRAVCQHRVWIGKRSRVCVDRELRGYLGSGVEGQAAQCE